MTESFFTVSIVGYAYKTLLRPRNQNLREFALGGETPAECGILTSGKKSGPIGGSA